jgi:hypothetical protein
MTVQVVATASVPTAQLCTGTMYIILRPLRRAEAQLTTLLVRVL